MQVVNLNGTGMVLANAGSEEVVISRLDEEGALLWENMTSLTFKSKKINRLLLGDRYSNSNHFLIASPSGSNTFLIESSGDVLQNSSKVRATHLDSTGLSRTVEFENLYREMGSTFHATFCDERYLYFLAKGREKRDPFHKKEESYILNRFDIHSFEYKKFILDLPEPQEDKYSESQWVFLGQYKGHKYLVNKFADTRDNIAFAKVLAINESGEVVRNFDISYTPKSGHIRPFHQVQFRDRNIALHENPDYYISKGGPFSSPYRNFRIGAYVDLQLNEGSGELFLSGLIGEKSFGRDPFHYKNQSYNGFYVCKFDPNGSLMWEMDQIGNDGILASKDFVHGYPPGHKNAALRVLSDLGFVNYTVQVNDKLHNYIINDAGEIVDLREKHNYQNATDHLAFLPEEFSGVPAYLESQLAKEQGLMFASVTGQRGEFLLQVDPTEEELKIIFFKYDAFHPGLHKELVEK